MMKPQIATTFDDGTYGQREMTDQEYAEWLSQLEPQPETPTPEKDAE